MVKLSSSLLLTLILSFQVAFGQSGDKETVTQSIQWFAFTSNIKMTNRLSWIVEGQFRQAGNFDPMQYQARTALNIKLNDHFSVVPLGYVYTWNYKYGKQPATFVNNEHRIWQQVFLKHDIGKLNVDHRLRVEERFLQHHSVAPDGDVIDDGYTNQQTRLRYRLAARLPLNSSKIEKGTYFASAYDEVFFSWGDNITYHNADQNRVFGGIGYQFDENFNIQGGCIYQIIVKSNGAKQENNVGFQVNVTYNVDWTKGSQ